MSHEVVDHDDDDVPPLPKQWSVEYRRRAYKQTASSHEMGEIDPSGKVPITKRIDIDDSIRLDVVPTVSSAASPILHALHMNPVVCICV